jgi:hypothetical protein
VSGHVALNNVLIPNGHRASDDVDSGTCDGPALTPGLGSAASAVSDFLAERREAVAENVSVPSLGMTHQLDLRCHDTDSDADSLRYRYGGNGP